MPLHATGTVDMHADTCSQDFAALQEEGIDSETVMLESDTGDPSGALERTDAWRGGTPRRDWMAWAAPVWVKGLEAESLR